MNKQQTIHISMLNSYNLILEKAKLKDIIYSGVGMFSHIPNDDIEEDDLNTMILYFESLDMYEHCAELILYKVNTFNDDGSYLQKDCECELPEIENYNLKMSCSKCNMRLRR